MTALIDAHATMAAYWAHIEPVFDALPDDRKGHVYVPTNLRHEVHGDRVRYTWPGSSESPLIVAGYQDLSKGIRSGKVLLEHGAGQRYAGVDSASYAGGPGREQADLFLCPRQEIADANLARYPNAHAAVVGCPRLDRLAQIPLDDDAEGTIAVAFHWPCTVTVESGWAWPTWRDALGKLARNRKVLGHCHPRARQQLSEWFARERIEFVPSSEELLARAETLIIDNSSFAYEWAACGRPVVLIDDATWRPGINHGLRFGEELPGPCAGASGDYSALVFAIDESRWYGEQRRRVTERVYGDVDGRASERAVEAILKWEATL